MSLFIGSYLEGVNGVVVVDGVAEVPGEFHAAVLLLLLLPPTVAPPLVALLLVAQLLAPLAACVADDPCGTFAAQPKIV